MPVIVFASNKGGVAKTTSAILAGTEFDRKGIPVTYIDLDHSNYSLTRWRDRAPLPPSIKFVEGVGEANVIRTIREHDKDNCLVIVDLEGVVSRMTSRAISQADLVIVPMSTSIDALVGSDALKLIKEEEELLGREIKYSVVMTRTNAAFPTKEERRVRKDLVKNQVHIIEPSLNSRAAFSALFYHGGTVHSMTKEQEDGLPQARENAALFADSVLARLNEEHKND